MYRDPNMSDEQEREANIFAMCLLMPEDFIRRDMDGVKEIDLIEDKRIKALAKRYGVTEQMMVMRLCELGYLRL
jgi:Zn-dependent peptidase ImmA (M78 family)